MGSIRVAKSSSRSWERSRRSWVGIMSGGGVVKAVNAEINIARIVEYSDHGFFGCRVSFQRLLLAEIIDRLCCAPQWIVKGAVNSGGVIRARRVCNPRPWGRSFSGRE